MRGIPIQLDRERTLRFGMRAIDYVEKQLKTPIQQLDMDSMTMKQTAVVILAGLRHEDANLTSEQVMDLIDDYSSMKVVFEALGEAMAEAFGKADASDSDSEDAGENDDSDSEDVGKNE